MFSWLHKSSKPKLNLISSPQKATRSVMLPLRIGAGRTIFSDDPNDSRMRMRFLYSAEEKKLLGTVWFGEATSGPPGHVHGGILCYAIDEAMGTTAWAEGYPVVAGQIHFQFAVMVPVEREYQIVCEIVKVENKKIHLRAQILSPGCKIHLQAESIFIRLPREKVEKLSANVPEGLKIPFDQMKWRIE